MSLKITKGQYCDVCGELLEEEFMVGEEKNVIEFCMLCGDCEDRTHSTYQPNGKYKTGVKCPKTNDLSSIICDAYDLKDRISVYGIADKSKDADGSEATIGECVEGILDFLQELETKL